MFKTIGTLLLFLSINPEDRGKFKRGLAMPKNYALITQSIEKTTDRIL